MRSKNLIEKDFDKNVKDSSQSFEVTSNFSNFDMIEEKAKELSDLTEETFWRLKEENFHLNSKKSTQDQFSPSVILDCVSCYIKNSSKMVESSIEMLKKTEAQTDTSSSSSETKKTKKKKNKKNFVTKTFNKVFTKTKSKQSMDDIKGLEIESLTNSTGYISYDLQSDKSEKELETSTSSEDSVKLKILEQSESSFDQVLTSTKIVDDDNHNDNIKKSINDDGVKIEKESVNNNGSVVKENNEKEDQIVDLLNTVNEKKEETFVNNNTDQEVNTDDCNAHGETREKETKNFDFFFLFLFVFIIFCFITCIIN